MLDQSRGAAVVIALFSSLAIGLIVTVLTLELFIYANGGAAPDSIQRFQALFAGFSFGLAAFTNLYATWAVDR